MAKSRISTAACHHPPCQMTTRPYSRWAAQPGPTQFNPTSISLPFALSLHLPSKTRSPQTISASELVELLGFWGGGGQSKKLHRTVSSILRIGLYRKMASCVSDTARSLSCRDGRAAAHLKLISIAVIFVTSVVGISSPVLLSRYFQGKPAYDKATLVIKCFAAGVILSTSLVHVLPDAFLALSDCRVSSHHPWKDYPFSGLVTMIGALIALLVDLTATSHMESHSAVGGHGHGGYKVVPVGAREELVGKNSNLKGKNSKLAMDVEVAVAVGVESNSGGGSEEMLIRMKQRLVSQVLEIGIIFHSVIIGVTMGMSQNQCTIRPLVAALSFHQIFEGMGLGGCIAQAGFKFGTTAYMCFMFAVTTPMGIVLGMILFSVTGYDDSNPNALILEGLLGSFSSGILIYMALVDLIALDFFHNKMMSSNSWLRKTSFIALVLGSTSMSILALWA